MSMRMAAAAARRVLVEMASPKLSPPADPLIVVNGQISAAFNRDKKTSYAELIGGRYFNVQLDWNKQMGNALYAPGKAQPKKHTEHKIVGQPIKREDVAPKVFAQEDFVVDIKVPGMVHGRVIRPAIAGAVPVKIDESSVKDIPGVQVVHQNGFLGVVAPKEWDAIKAMQQLKVEWSKVEPPFPNQNALYDHIRKAPVRKSATEGKTAGNVDEAFKTAARVIEAEYEWPFQSHACMGPACAVVAINGDKVDCWSGTQKSHFVQTGLAAQLGVPLNNVHVRWINGPGSYGRNDAGDACMDAAILSKAVGKPVKVVWSREDDMQHDYYRPISYARMWGAVDEAGRPTLYKQRLVQQSLMKRLGGLPPNGVDFISMDGCATLPYDIPNLKIEYTEQDPGIPYGFWRSVGASFQGFAVEAFIDELATTAGKDPYEFRKGLLSKAPRHLAALNLAAEKAGWGKPLPQGRARGIAVMEAFGSILAQVTEVSVDAKGAVDRARNEAAEGAEAAA